MGLTRGQVLAELERRGQLPADLKGELDKVKSGGDQDFLSSLPADRAALVRSIGEGRVKPPTATRGPGMALMQDVATAYPGFDAGATGAKFAAQTDAAKGAIAKNTTSLNTAIGHLGSLAANVDKMGNVAIPLVTQPFNWLKNTVGVSSGDATPRQFGIDRQAVADELETTFRGGGKGGTEQGTKGWALNLNANDSAAQQRAAIAEAAKLLQSRVNALGDQYRTAHNLPAGDMSFLSPEALAAMKRFSSPGFITGGPVPPPPSGGGPGGPGGGSSGPGLPIVSGGGGSQTLATGDTRKELDPVGSARLEQMMRDGASFDAVNAAFPGSSQVEYDNVRKALAANPNLTGFGKVTRTVPNTAWDKFKSNPIVQSVGTAALGAGDAALMGTSDEIGGLAKSLFTGRPASEEIADLNRDKQAAFAANPGSALLGQTVGTIAGAAGAGGRIAALAERYAAPRLAASIAGDVAFGAASGAGQDNDHRTAGAVIGGLGALGGNLLGMGAGKAVGAAARTAPGVAFINNMADKFGDTAIGRMAGLTSVTPAAALTPAEQAVASAATKAGPQPILSRLAEADDLGVPMSLSDTHPELRELAGAAVRRSPTASAFAEDNLIPRSRGQYDRFTTAVDQNLGPTVNIPQRSADLTAQAREAAGPLYDKAYAAPVVSTPELESTLNTPFGQQALARAKTIAANERRDPMELGFATDPDGNVVLNPRPNQAIADHLDARAGLDAAQDAYRSAKNSPTADLAGARDQVSSARQTLRDAETRLSFAPDPSQPASVPAYSTQSLDYVKRGMDDVLEQYRNPMTGKLELDEAGRAQVGLKNQFLNEVDRINPDYAAARSAYAGPASERSNMAAGQAAYSANPQQLGVDIAGSSPERLGQMQLGYQRALIDHSASVRDSSNPWETTLGSPMARDRLGVMFPDGAPGGVPGGINNILRTRDLEGDMQSTTNAILGNSRTARNQIADQAFQLPPIVGGIIDAGTAVATHGASLPATALRLGGNTIGDALKLRAIGSSAVAKADDLGPILMTPDAVTSSATLNDILAKLAARRGFVDATTPTGPLSTAGAALGSQALVAPLTYRAAP